MHLHSSGPNLHFNRESNSDFAYLHKESKESSAVYANAVIVMLCL